jgi:tRNA modification GTPase
MLDDTIAAIATPVGEGGLAIIRLSGPEALAIADRVFRSQSKPIIVLSQAPSHTLHYGVIERDGRVVDEVLAGVMRAPKTYTREDTVEITSHGGLLVVRVILEELLKHGARLAQPGEFTKRAFLSGRIDLAQAEGVVDLIRARTDLALAAASDQLTGKLSQRINHLRDELLPILAHLEAHIDFPDEDIAPESRAQIGNRFIQALAFIEELLKTAREGQILRCGIRTAIIGRPNTGKSSLLNQLLGHDRAIVSPIAGTTRDTIEEAASIRGIPVIFIDTAGLRQAGDVLELEGIRRSRHALERSELVLQVLDGSQALTTEDQALLSESSGKKRILVCNKSDLTSALQLSDDTTDPIHWVSCVTSQGIEELKELIFQQVWTGRTAADGSQVLINARHQDALRRAQSGLAQAQRSLCAEEPLELVAVDLRIAVNAVGEIVGKTTTEDLLDTIFGQFCLGK